MGWKGFEGREDWKTEREGKREREEKGEGETFRLGAKGVEGGVYLFPIIGIGNRDGMVREGGMRCYPS